MNTSKKLLSLFFAIFIFTLVSCDNQQGNKNADERVISRDTIETKVEVEETVVKYDTTTSTETITNERDRESGERGNDRR